MNKVKSSKGQSAMAVGLGIGSSSIWLVYGILNSLTVVQVTSGTFVIVEIVWLWTVLRYRGTDE